MLSTARRTVQNAFGILTQKWRLYQRRVQLEPDTVDKVESAGHAEEDGRHRQEHEEEEIVDHFLPAIPPLRGHRQPLQAMRNRDTLCRYFTSPEGQVDWQLQRLR